MDRKIPLVKNSKGCTFVEYALLVSLISITTLFGIQAVGEETTESFEQVNLAFEVGGTRGTIVSDGPPMGLSTGL